MMEEDLGQNNLWVSFYWGDYLRKTSDLTPLEHGIYCLLLAHYYSEGQPLPADRKRLAYTLRLHTKREFEVLDKILQRFFVEQDGVYHNGRADEEIAKRLERSQKARESVNVRYTNVPTNVPTNVERTNTHTHTHTQKISGAARATRIPADFDANDTSRKLAQTLKLDVAYELTAFKDYWESKGGTHIDWNKAFYTWLRKSAEYKFKAKPRPVQPSLPDVAEALRRQRGE